MPKSRAGSTLLIYAETPEGLCVEGTVSAGSPETTASVFVPGALVTDLSTGILYRNSGTTAAPVWDDTTSSTRSEMSAPAARKPETLNTATIATTGNTDGYVIVAEAGTLASIDFSGVDALAASDTNYITWTVTNLGQAGAGSTAMLAATAANTTKTTGGTALAANTVRSLTVHGTAANLVVASGDRLLVRAAATGTLANTVTFPTYLVRFTGTT